MFERIAEFILNKRITELESRVNELERLLSGVKLSFLNSQVPPLDQKPKNKYPSPPIVKTPPLRKIGFSP